MRGGFELLKITEKGLFYDLSVGSARRFLKLSSMREAAAPAQGLNEQAFHYLIVVQDTPVPFCCAALPRALQLSTVLISLSSDRLFIVSRPP